MAIITYLRPHDALAVANFFLDKAADSGDGPPIDYLKLQKLVYFAHGWHLAVCGRNLIWQTVLAWPYGPVIRQVYDEFKGYGRDVIDGRATLFDDRAGEQVPIIASFSTDSQDVLERVWKVYKRYTGLQLSTMAHAEGTPWHQTVGHLKPEQIRDVVIPNETIRQHYIKLAKERNGVNQLAASSSRRWMKYLSDERRW